MKKRGFTLIELLASLAIISVLVLAASQIFSISINLTKKSYENELDFKEYSYACLFVDNIVRSAYKIELLDKPNEVSNFVAYVKNPIKGKDEKYFKVSTYVFDVNESNGTKSLVARVNNISDYDSDSNRRGQDKSSGASMVIAKCQSARIIYDQGNIIHIFINENSQKYRYESKINLGNRLWKKLLYLFTLY